MLTRKQWNEYKKKNKIPDGAVEGVEFGPALEKCQKVVDSDKSLADKLKAVNEFRKTFSRYSKELDTATKTKAKKFLTDVGGELDVVEKDVFDAAAKNKDGKGAVVNLDAGDNVIDKAAKDIAQGRKLGEDKPLRRMGETDDATDSKGHDAVKLGADADFSKASNEPIILLAHGSPIGNCGSGKVRATHFANKKPDEIIAFIAKTLPLTYSGVVYLDGCYTAAGNTPLNFGKLVYDGLVKKGYHYLQIKGNLGIAKTVDNKEFVVPAELEDEYNQLEAESKKLDAEIAALEKQYDDARQLILQKTQRLFGGKDLSQMTDAELKTKAELDEKNKSIVKLQSENKPLTEKRNRRKEVLDLTNNKLTITALTGTFGPERLPPKQ